MRLNFKYIKFQLYYINFNYIISVYNHTLMCVLAHTLAYLHASITHRKTIVHFFISSFFKEQIIT